MKTSNESPLDRVQFNKAQLAYLEKLFGTWETVGKSVNHDSDIGNLCREAGKQDVLDAIRERTI